MIIMEDEKFSTITFQDHITSLMSTMVSVITHPAVFFNTMPKTGGLIEPLIFLAVMGGIGAMLQSVLSFFGEGLAASLIIALAIVVVGPIVTAIFGLIISTILYFIWKLMGSQETIETAFRCAAYASATIPLTTLFVIVPCLGSLIGLAWMTYLMVIASVEVHQLDAMKARIVFGIIAGIFALFSISSQIAAHRIFSNIDQFQTTINRYDQISPEEVGEKAGNFLKGIKKGLGKQ